MAQIPQPFSVEWSPSTMPMDAPSWEPLGRVASLTVDRGRGPGLFDEYAPGTASMVVRNGNHAGEAPEHQLSNWRRWTRLRVMSDHEGTPRPVFTGFITKLDHDLSDAPHAGRVSIKATDAMGVWNRDTIARDTIGTTVRKDMLGFGPYTIAELAEEINFLSGAAGTADVAGLGRLPVDLPVSFTTEANVEVGRFVDNAYGALKSALKVEMGSVHIASDGGLAVNGRYAMADAVSGTWTLPFQLTDGTIDYTPAYGFESISFADPIAEYHNGAVTAGLRKNRVRTQGAALEVGEFDDLIDRTDLWTEDENAVAANSRLLAALYGGVKRPWPAEVTVAVWNTAMADFALLTSVLDVTDILGRAAIAVSVTQPGSGGPSGWSPSIEGVRLDVTSSKATATLKLGASAERWLERFDLSVGIFALGVAGRGLGSGAILGP